MNKPIGIIQESSLLRSFTKDEHKLIKDVKAHMSVATDVKSWNELRELAKKKWDEKIISAVDGLRKWVLSYDKPTKSYTLIGVKF